MKIVVVGDTLLDEDIDGVAERFQPDAPVPVVDVHTRRSRAGGAGLVARMLQHDGHDVHLVTALSADEPAERLRQHLDGVHLVAGLLPAPTPVKTRLRAAGQPVARIDDGCGDPVLPHVTREMLTTIAEADAIIVSDYGRALTAHPEIRVALHRRGTQVPLVWDPHPRGADPVPSARLVTPNLAEAAKAAGTGADAAAAAAAGARLRERWGCSALVITLGSEGALLLDADHAPALIPARPVDAADACGAGDRFAASVLLALAADAELPNAVRSAVDAAGDFLAAGGVAALGAAGLPRASASADAFTVAERVRSSGGTVVATGGCFDLLHAGHVRTLTAARALGDCLIVCLNSDDSVRRLKGPERPLISEPDRVELLTALGCVDAVVVFAEDGPQAVLDQLRPDIWVKGGDYSAQSLPETDLVESWGGSVLTLPYHLGRSTTALADAIARVG
ncbi:D-glycero-beta-D-manno-heptose 1-phosphate adenylyltransferase [Leucobacter sp. NPDC077196]|uniref:D-glycero-beta-D-manno-heptose 1-phosphate adenylyltransferase n=1 Tax=Leucobacter sp. NPDC077196 TaxID=3154959 RepID=UPI00343C4CEB